MGCGRMFEGTYEQMFASLQNLATLPDDTSIYCAHEYTQANGKFAISVEPGNAALQQRVKEVISPTHLSRSSSLDPPLAILLSRSSLLAPPNSPLETQPAPDGYVYLCRWLKHAAKVSPQYRRR